MVKIRLLAVATMCAMLALATILPQYGLVGTVFAAPEAGPGFVLPNSGTNAAQAGKYPSVAGAGSNVHMVANTNGAAQYWTKSDTAASASGPANFGNTNGDTDYAGASIASASNGTLYAVWINQRSTINMKRKPVGGDWEDTKAIYRTGSFMSYVDIGVTGSGQIFVVWNQDNLYRYILSTDGGNNWSGAGTVSSKKPYRSVSVAGGPNNTAVVAFGGGDGHAYASVWNGSSFDTANLTPFKSSSDFFASAKPAVAPNGKIYVAFRNAPAGSLYYSERQTDGSWPVSKLAGGQIYEAIGIATDSASNVHMSWSSNAAGRWDLYYAFLPAGGEWQGPLKASGISNKIVANVDMSTTVGARSYGHVVFETFDGDAATVRYQQFSGEGSGTSATPSLDGGATATRNSVVTVSFSNVTGSPDSVRYNWDSAPTDTNPWVAFTSPLTVQGPTGVSAAACETHTLYTQVRKGTSAGSTNQDALIFDTAVQAEVSVLNPHLAGLPASFGLRARDVATGTNGASDGDPKYTRERSFYLGISGQNDCSNLDTFHIAGSDSDPTPRSIVSNSYSGPAALPQGSAPGDRAISVDVTDKLGNKKTVDYTLTYDPVNTDTTGTQTNTLGLPVLGAGGNVTVDSAANIIRSFSFNNISVTDNLYGRRENLANGKQFWGVWMANATSDVGADSAALNWYPVRVGAPNSSFTVKWNLFSGLGFTSDLRNKPGNYFVYVRFLDGAGNPSTQSLKIQVTLAAGYDIPTVRIPAVAR
ncbi:MAG TPA: hypothetical protein VFU22_14870 [Roseiflexaceae bacterium]|nr:hypothetical protein [Roseiflexaceae bacterium]